MIEYTFWTHDKVDTVEALIFTDEFSQNTFTKFAVLSETVGEHHPNAKKTNKALALPDPVNVNSLVYNGKRTGRTYETLVAHEDGTSVSYSNTIVGARSIPYDASKNILTISVSEVKDSGNSKQVLEIVLSKESDDNSEHANSETIVSA